MKKLLAVLLALTLAFSSLACALPTKLTAKDKQTETTKKEAAAVEEVVEEDAATDEETAKDTKDAKDKKDAKVGTAKDEKEDYSELFGIWKPISVDAYEADGESLADLSTEDLDYILSYNCVVFTHDGRCAFMDGYVFSDEVYEAFTTGSWYTVEDGKLVNASSEVDESYIENISYVLSSKGDEQTLTITEEATEIKGPTKKAHYEVTLTFVRDYEDIDALYEYSLLGNWTDNFGNKWAFSVNEESTSFSLSFELTDSSGKKYASSPISSVWVGYDEDEKVTEIDFIFEVHSNDIYAEIVSFDGNVLEMTQDDGSSLVLTRVVGK